jgi:hypothetical protein
VVDIPATLASRVRLLGTGRSDKNDPNDARSAIAALRAAELVPVRVEDHAPVLRLVSRRHTQLGWTYNKTACRHDAHRDLRRRCRRRRDHPRPGRRRRTVPDRRSVRCLQRHRPHRVVFRQPGRSAGSPHGQSHP